jgi:hypothetical protein
MPPKRRVREAEALRLELKQADDERGVRRRVEEKEKRDEREERKQKAEKQEREWNGQLLRAVIGGFEIVKAPGLGLREEAKVTQVASIDTKKFSRREMKEPALVFAKVVPLQVWKHICTATNESIDFKVRNGIAKSTYAANYYKPLTVAELISIFGVRMRNGLEGKEVKGEVSIKRVRAVMSSLRCDWPVLVPLLRDAWQSCISPSEVCTVDELLMAYNCRGAQRDHCPKRFIPRKPHPNGLLCYLAAFKTRKNLPLVFDLSPDLSKDSPLNPKRVICAGHGKSPPT